jgi:hypothetical protein
MDELTDRDWSIAKIHLQQLRALYVEIGTAGLFGLTYVLNPLFVRLKTGERTQELYDKIMETK